jgi:uncharacterized protein YktB (UPF0637 family)
MVVGVALLLAQLGNVIYAHVAGSRRYFAWAPNDYAVVYSIATEVRGHPLTPAQIRDRYQIKAQGLWEDPPQRLIDFLNRYEKTYGAKEHARVVLRYSLDGHPERTWQRG